MPINPRMHDPKKTTQMHKGVKMTNVRINGFILLKRRHLLYDTYCKTGGENTHTYTGPKTNFYNLYKKHKHPIKINVSVLLVVPGCYDMAIPILP